MRSLLKKIVVFVLVGAFVVSAVPKRVYAQEWYNPSYDDFYDKVFKSDPNEIFGERYTFAQITWIIHSLNALLTPQIAKECTKSGPIECFRTVSQSLGQINSPQEMMAAVGPMGVLGLASDSILTTPPASGVASTKALAARIHLIPEARAQGAGFESLSGTVQQLWKATRDMSYALMVLIIIALAFMIMFRVKISPQVVITAQSALPKVAITLILITFSFAIAGFLFDLSYLVVGLLAALLKQSGIVGVDLAETYKLLSRGLLASGGIETGVMGFLLLYSLSFMMMVLLILSAGGIVGYFTAGAGTLGGIFLSIPFLIMGIALFIAMLKIVWILLRTWVVILLQVIAAPFLILLGNLPGMPGFGSWLKNLLGNLVVFPITSLLLVVSHVFFWGSVPKAITDIPGMLALNPFNITGGTFSAGALPPPMLRFPAGQGLGEFSILGWLTSYAVIFMIPSVAAIVKSMIQARPFEYGAAIGRPLAAGFGIATYPVKQTFGIVSESRTKAMIEAISSKGGQQEPVARQARKFGR